MLKPQIASPTDSAPAKPLAFKRLIVFTSLAEGAALVPAPQQG